ncbi:hypothetical protein [Aureimonas sp. SK2]|uniref:hypothetical protein n=1 Tax=Aureimonas sp. SK2 TaxID=3015992 RepID=UPI0024450487|nr:hypothetical protein [Aureimonas sp. SK2]
MMLARGFAIATIAAIGALPVAPAQAQDAIAQLFKNAGAGCDSSVASTLTEAIRSGIEAEVKRAEAALKLPAGVSGLGCLDDLFSINLDTMISLPNLQSLLNGAVAGAEQQLCSFAQEKWAEITEPLTAALQLPSFDRLGIPGFSGSGGGMQIQFTTPTVGFGSQGGSPSFYTREDLGEGTQLRDEYERIYGSGR